MTVLSATLLLIFIMNPLGNLPFFLATLKPIPPKKHTYIIIREIFFSYMLLIIFMFFGKFILQGVQITEQALGISGGVILFLIALRMIFPKENASEEKQPASEPFLVPLAIPMTAGPGTIATVMLLSSKQPDKKLLWVMAIAIASIIVGATLICGRYLSKYLGQRGLTALERLSGMILTAIAAQMFLSGVNAYFKLY